VVSVDLKPGSYIYQFKLKEKIFINKQGDTIAFDNRIDLYHVIDVKN